MHEEIIPYVAGTTPCQGYFVHDPAVKGKRPLVLVIPSFMGLDEFAKQKARDLCGLGYAAFAVDYYGNGTRADTHEKASELMLPLFLDRALLRQRILGAYEAASKLPQADSQRMGAIGFCFGGLVAIELFRSGAKLRGVVTFHAVLGNARGENKAHTVPMADNVSGSLLVLHGHDDPLVSKEDVEKFQTEMSAAKVDWQMHIYSHTVHAFTNPAVSDFKGGLSYNAKANRRSWQSMRNFFEEIFV